MMNSTLTDYPDIKAFNGKGRQFMLPSLGPVLTLASKHRHHRQDYVLSLKEVSDICLQDVF